ncbi:hypothetical protein ACY2DA_02100 [Staphylococcus simulans]
MKRHHMLFGLLCSTLLLVSCGPKDHHEETQANQQQEETTDTQSQDKSSQAHQLTHPHKNQDINVVVHETEKKDNAHSNTKANKDGSAKQTEAQTDTAVPSSETNEALNLEKSGSKVKGPEFITPGPEAERDRQHIAMMLLNPKLNKTYVNAKDLKQKTYTTGDGQKVRISNYILFQSLEVPQVENGPEGMQYYFVTHTKDANKKTILGISDNEIVIGKSTISPEDAISQNVKLNYNQFIEEAETQQFKVKDLEQLNLDSDEIHALAQHIYQTTPHTLQFVPEQ